MKKLFVVLVVMLLLAIAACSGGGSSSSGSSSITTSAIVNSTGGSVQLSDGANVTIPSGVVADGTNITITRLAQPQVYASQATAVTGTYQITIPASSIMTQSGNNNLVTFQIPIPTSVSATVKKALSKIRALVSNSTSADTSYYLSEVAMTMSNSSTTTALYGTYSPSNGNAIVSIVSGAWTALESIASDVNAVINVTIADTSNFFSNIQPALYNVGAPSTLGGNVTYTQVSNLSNNGTTYFDQTQNVGSKTPIILVHGWTMSSDTNGLFNSQQTTWANFINYFYSDKNLPGQFALYTYRYDPTQDIDYNALTLSNNNTITNNNSLQSTILNCFPSQNVIIIAHSMGGLVAHSYIQRGGGNSKVTRLITLATPYHGSPLVQYLHNSLPGGQAVLDVTNCLLNLNSTGTNELAWDNYNGSTSTNTYLSTLNNNANYGSIYTAFAGYIDPKEDGVNMVYPLLDILDNLKMIFLPHGFFDIFAGVIATSFSSISNGMSDGFVTLDSAFNAGYPNGFVTMDSPNGESDYDHGQMAQGKGDSVLFNNIKNNALPIINVPFTSVATTGYFPLNVNDSYDFKDSATNSNHLTTIASGPTIGGVATTAVIYWDNQKDYYTYDQNGLTLYGQYVISTNYTGDVIFDNPLNIMPNPATTNVTNILTTTYTISVSGQTYHVTLESLSTVLGYEDVKTNGDMTLKDCLKVLVQFYQTVTETGQSVLGDTTYYWFYKGIGPVKQVVGSDTDIITAATINGYPYAY